jgi:hypothetical protein
MDEFNPLRPVRHEVDRETGRLTVYCDAETFDRIRRSIQEAAGLGVLIHVPPVTVRAVSVELEEFETATTGPAAWLAGWGCLAGVLAAVGVFGVGLWTVWGWAAAWVAGNGP